MKITKEIIEQGRSREGGWSKAQLKILGVEWQPPKGWIGLSIRKEFTDEEIKLFLDLTNKHLE